KFRKICATKKAEKTPDAVASFAQAVYNPPAVNPSLAVTDIVQALKQGREIEQNFELLYRHSYAQVYSFFLRKKKSAEEAQELTQETFFSVYISLNQLRQDDQFFVWLYQIARRTLYNQRQKEHAQKRAGQNVPLEFFGPDESDEKL